MTLGPLCLMLHDDNRTWNVLVWCDLDRFHEVRLIGNLANKSKSVVCDSITVNRTFNSGNEGK